MKDKTDPYNNRLAAMQAGIKRPEYEIDAFEDAFEALDSAQALANDLLDNPSTEAVAVIFAALFNDARLNRRLIEEALKKELED